MKLTKEQQEMVQRHLNNGDWVGVFQNEALDSAQYGEKFAMFFDDRYWDGAKIGFTTMPDTKERIGWKYILRYKCKTLDEVVEALA